MAALGGILALDLATVLGWAWASKEAVHTWPRTMLEAQAFKPGATGLFRSGAHRLAEPGSSDGIVGAAYREWLEQHLRFFQPTWIVFEAPLPPTGSIARRSLRTARRLMGLAFLTDVIAHEAGLEAREVHISTVKRHFAGHGGAKKPAMIAACHARGIDVKSPDEADAVAVLDVSIAFLVQHREEAGVASSAERRMITTLAELDELDGDELAEGYLDGARDEPPPGDNRSKAYRHGWRTGMMDRGRLRIDAEIRLLAKLVVGRWRQ